MAKSGTLTFTPGETTQVVQITLLNCQHSLSSGFLTFSFKLSGNGTGSSIVSPTTEVNITGDVAASTTPALYALDAEVDASAGSVNVPVVLGGPSGAAQGVPVTVDYTTNDGSALAGTDYTTTSGTLTFPPGETAQNISVPILDRSGAAATRSFSVTLSTPTNATVADAVAVVTIGASGAPAVALPEISAPPNVVVGEADGYIDLPVTLNAPGESTVTVSYATTDGTASGAYASCEFASSAYVAKSGTLTFTPGETTQVVQITLLNCPINPASLKFTFGLTNPVKATILSTDTTVTIVATPGIPGAPTSVAAVPGNQRATVSFAAPASDGGDPVNSDTVTASPGGAAASGVSSPITVTGLTNGTSYTFTVVATNDVGTGSSSAASNAVTPAVILSTPTTPTISNLPASGAVGGGFAGHREHHRGRNEVGHLQRDLRLHGKWVRGDLRRRRDVLAHGPRCRRHQLRGGQRLGTDLHDWSGNPHHADHLEPARLRCGRGRLHGHREHHRGRNEVGHLQRDLRLHGKWVRGDLRRRRDVLAHGPRCRGNQLRGGQRLGTDLHDWSGNPHHADHLEPARLRCGRGRLHGHREHHRGRNEVGHLQRDLRLHGKWVRGDLRRRRDVLAHGPRCRGNQLRGGQRHGTDLHDCSGNPHHADHLEPARLRCGRGRLHGHREHHRGRNEVGHLQRATSVCTVSGFAVTYVGVGTCSLTAHVAAGTNFAAANGTAQTFMVTAAPAPYSPLSPVRICDTRATSVSGLTGVAAQCNGNTIAAGTVRTINVANSVNGGLGSFGVPATATAVMLNVTVVNPAGSGHVTVFPAGTNQPTASNINYQAGANIPGLVDVGVGTGGMFHSSAWLRRTSWSTLRAIRLRLPPEGRDRVSTTLCPVRFGSVTLDPGTRRTCRGRLTPSAMVGTAILVKRSAAGEQINVEVVGASSGSTSIPAGATAAVLNVTAADTSSNGHLTVFPTGSQQPTAVERQLRSRSCVRQPGRGAALDDGIILRVGNHLQLRPGGCDRRCRGVLLRTRRNDRIAVHCRECSGATL